MPIKYGSETKRRVPCPNCGQPMFCKSEQCFKCARASRAESPVEYIKRRIVAEDRGHSSPCWIWQGQLNHAGYGCGMNTELGGKFNVHRAAYELLVGAIPEGMTIDHLCRNRSCCNPEHLEPVTWEENKRRAIEHRGLSQNPKSVYMREYQRRKREMAA